MNLGEQLRTHREAAGILPSELAEKCRVTATHVYDIENGKRNPSESLLLRMAEHLGVDVEPLLELMRRRKEIMRRVRKNPEEFEALMEEKCE